MHPLVMDAIHLLCLLVILPLYPIAWTFVWVLYPIAWTAWTFVLGTSISESLVGPWLRAACTDYGVFAQGATLYIFFKLALQLIWMALVIVFGILAVSFGIARYATEILYENAIKVGVHRRVLVDRIMEYSVFTRVWLESTPRFFTPIMMTSIWIR